MMHHPVVTLARHILALEEGWRESPYYCTKGYPTVGYGFLIGEKGAPLPKFKLPREAGDAWLDALIVQLRAQVLPRIMCLNEPRQAVIISMCYQLGVNGCLAFKNMWSAIERGDWVEAGSQMQDSKWWREDTRERADRHIRVMIRGSVKGVYAIR